MRKQKRVRAIRDTDIVYSCVIHEGYYPRLRFTMHPEDMRAAVDGPRFKHRTLWVWQEEVGRSAWLARSCYSPGPYIDIDRADLDDSWLDWLAEGEPGRGVRR